MHGHRYGGRVAEPDLSLDEALSRAHQLFLEDLSDEGDKELETLLPALVAAGYVVESGHSPTGSFWAFTESGVRRGEELGCI
jgi:hypothetical protein